MTNDQIDQLKAAMEYDALYYIDDGAVLHKCVRVIDDTPEPDVTLEGGRCVSLLKCNGGEFVRLCRIFGDINK